MRRHSHKHDRRHAELSYLQKSPGSHNSDTQPKYLRSISYDDHYRTKPACGQPRVRYLQNPPSQLTEIVDIDGVPTRGAHPNYEQYSYCSSKGRTSSPYITQDYHDFEPLYRPDEYLYEGDNDQYSAIPSSQYRRINGSRMAFQQHCPDKVQPPSTKPTPTKVNSSILNLAFSFVRVNKSLSNLLL